ncbi:hypothetical protein DsansV1_C46g0241741 [Dioscorea sansibarensis]
MFILACDLSRYFVHFGIYFPFIDFLLFCHLSFTLSLCCLFSLTPLYPFSDALQSRCSSSRRFPFIPPNFGYEVEEEEKGKGLMVPLIIIIIIISLCVSSSGSCFALGHSNPSLSLIFHLFANAPYLVSLFSS